MERNDPRNEAMAFAVRGALAQADMSQEQLAESLGMGRNTVIRRLSGRLPFTYPELVDVARITGQTAAELFEAAERIYSRSAA